MFDRPLEIPEVLLCLPLLACLRFTASSAFLLRRVCSRPNFPSGIRMRAGNYGGFPLNLSLWRVHGLPWLPLICPAAPDPCSSLRMDFITCWRRMSVHWILTAHPPRHLQSVVLLSPTVLKQCRCPARNNCDNWQWVHTWQIPFECMQPMKTQ